MARLEGTGKDPLGRYGKGEVFDVPSDAPVYQELIDNGFAKKVAPEDDPARTVTQIADDIVSGRGTHADPADAKIAAGISTEGAYAIVHTGDPSAKASDLNGNLKPDAVVESQQDANPAPELQEVPATEQGEKQGSTSGTRASSGAKS